MKYQDENIMGVIRRLLLHIRQREITGSQEEKDELWHNITTDVKGRNRKQIRRKIIYISSSVAAVLVAILLINIFYYTPQPNGGLSVAQVTFDQDINNTEEILLIVSDNKQVEIEDQSDIIYGPDGSIVVNSQDVDKLSDNSSNKKEVEYNQLIVPKGRRTMITLSDNTKMWVNSGSRVVYPRNFAKGVPRNVFVDGEIYLEVTHDKEQAFIVCTKTFDVQVLGTSFNVCSYEGLNTASVVLVEGLVDIKDSHNKKSRLSPNQLITIDDKGLGEKKEVEALDYISWTQGLFTLHAEPFGVVLGKLGRYYGVKVEYDNIDKNIPITGKLDLKNDFEEVLDGLGTIVPITYSSQNGIYQVKIKE